MELKSIEVLSPLVAHHFLLNLPPIKESMQLDAVSYAIRSLYPFNSETTIVDYSIIGSTTVGIVMERDRLKIISQTNKILISPVLAISFLQSNGMAICISKDWIMTVQLKKNIPIEIHTYQIIDNIIPPSMIEMINNCNSSEEMKVWNFNNNCYLNDTLEKNMIHVSDIKSIHSVISKKIVKKSIVFSLKKKGHQFLYKSLYCGSLLVLFLISSCIFFRMRSMTNKKEIELKELKNKLEAMKNEQKQNIEVKELILPETIPISMLLNKFRELDSSLSINSFTYTDKSFRIEADSISAIGFYNELIECELFYNITLYQVRNISSEKETFVIAGVVY